MKKSKKILSLVLCVIMIATTLCGLATTASARTSGGSGSATIYVRTKANYFYPGASSVTLQQSKQTITCKSLTGNKTKKVSDYYGYYQITVYNVTKNSRTTVNWNGGKTKKISLDPNCTYKITVRYDSYKTVMFNNTPLGYTYDRISSPSWNVKSTWKLSSCQ